MTHITKEQNDAILKALYDTGHRFNSNWRQIILDIVEEFGAIGSMGSSLVAEDLRGFYLIDVGFADTSRGGCWGIHKPITRELLSTVELSDVNTPWADEDIVIGERWGKVGPKAGWFLERIRELNFTGTEDHREFSYRGGGASYYRNLRDGWWWNMCGVAGGNERLSGCLEEITWSVLIKYLSFIREMSDWTMPLMPGRLQSASRDCVNHWQRLMNGEVSGMGEGHVYECFNQEQGERLPAAWTRIANFPRREHVVSHEDSGDEGDKKKMIHEILEILEDKAEKSELGEGAYKGYSELLMEFYKSI